MEAARHLRIRASVGRRSRPPTAKRVSKVPALHCRRPPGLRQSAPARCLRSYPVSELVERPRSAREPAVYARYRVWHDHKLAEAARQASGQELAATWLDSSRTGTAPSLHEPTVNRGIEERPCRHCRITPFCPLSVPALRTGRRRQTSSTRRGRCPDPSVVRCPQLTTASGS